jgi:hypothetical protein
LGAQDGYSDLRGCFDYASLSSSKLGRVARLALLVRAVQRPARALGAHRAVQVLTESHGAVVREVEPPPLA